MRAGRFDRFVTIQRKTVTQDSYGQPVETWANLVDREPAAYTPYVPARGGAEKYVTDQLIAIQQVTFDIRYSTAVSTVSPLDRLIYPALETGVSPADTPTDNEIFDIDTVAETGRRQGLRIIARRRPDSSS